MKYFLISLTILWMTSTNAQTAEDSVKTVVNTMFTAMRNGDAQLFRSVFGDSAFLQGFSRTKEGNTIIVTESISEFADFVSQLKKDSADERIRFETIKIDGPMAIAWTPYRFYHNGKFSHCGVNSFQLVRINNAWKIQYIIDTRRTTGCL